MIDATVVDVADHADDFIQRSGASDAEPLAECRRGLAPQLTGQGVRHDDDGAAIVDIRPGEIPAGEQRNPQCLEQTWSDGLGTLQWRNAFGVRLALSGHHHVVLVVQLHGQCTGEGGGRDPWDPGDLIQDVLLHPCDALGLGGLPFRDGDTHRLDVIRVRKSRLDAPQRLEASNHEAGSDEQHDRQRDLYEHERVLRSMLSTTWAQCSTVTSCRSLKRLGPSYSGVFQDRQEPEEQGRQERDTKREGQNEWIDRDLRETRERCGTDRYQEAQACVGKRDSEGSSQQGECDAFHEQVARDVGPACAQGRAHRQLSPAPLGAHEQQVGDVGTRNDQHDANRSHQQPQHRLDVTDHVLLDGPHGGTEACSVEDVGVGAALLDPDGQHAADVRVGLSE